MTPLLSPRLLERLGVLDLATRRAGGGGGAGDRPAGIAGAGTVFLEHRPYSPGDDVRYVDWNVFARLRSLHVKLHELEETLDLHLLVDRTASMGSGPGSKLEAALRSAALVGAVALARGDLVRLQLLPGEEGARPARSFVGAGATAEFLRTLAAVGGGAAAPLGTALRAAFPRLRERGAALLVSDFLDEPREPAAGWRRAVDFLVHRRVALTCLHVVAPEERDPTARGPVRLLDSETGERLDLDLDEPALRRYRERFELRLREIRAYLRGKRVRHVLLDASRAAEAPLLRLLLQERVLR